MPATKISVTAASVVLLPTLAAQAASLTTLYTFAGNGSMGA
jgi:hypothetical protein